MFGAVLTSCLLVAVWPGSGPSALAQSTGDPSLVRTDTGLVRGTVATDHRSFLGVPYAAAPTGNLRWRSPQPRAPWPSTWDGTRTPNACPQPSGSGMVPSVDEDCLKLSVHTPLRLDRPLPVMVWLHGGGFRHGAASQYDPTRMVVRGDVIIVTVNYRLNVFGFLTSDALDTATERSGDFGLQDQQAALRWVKRNAAAFGGDPGNVTLFGESAGALSVCAHLASPSAAGLFHRAIIQSGPCSMPFRTRAEAAADGAAFAQSVGCSGGDVAACLRAKPVRDLLAVVATRPPLAPPVGASVLPVQPRTALADGTFQKVPLLVGGNRDEARFFVGQQYDEAGKPVTAEQYPILLERIYGANAARVRAEYPLAQYPTPSLALATAQSDHNGVGAAVALCAGLWTDRLAARHVPVRAYEFADGTAPERVVTPGFPHGAEHTAELQYLFRYANAGGELDSAQRQLGDQMIAYWTSFAATGTPTAPGGPTWPAFRSDTDVLAFAPGPGGTHTVDFGTQHHCGFWESLGVPGT
ncbi:para-nitrobenzyl esterase [Streptoalloteichus tenebrarius]|uniref:Carboxylic ester hydrolase n=1 Tax=Streptoalloteichus tenebrarius (strain ATCC 17920 / DSM 40477 / JCM 4838 / CBS 697.72 / NBRC 16177 / NCIMB 11028 / NRRL B-12390 / A12253. 1 / ISP 5477) TaxID=1933 RepID=A0ABT1HXL9_STRSD|nr:carboxylesterase family protein [Streptoalloteichus tenebrarius]MCP2260259.1 para-nitrobenzyl esterase [Streptoalloteichus tenebrarius]BFF03008.1 carboxylesterase family protein [Streptoalloteichus tenebrarius]